MKTSCKRLAIYYLTTSSINVLFAIFSTIVWAGEFVPITNYASLEKTAKQITVQIQTPGGSGSGTLVHSRNNRYYVLTSQHVVEQINPVEESYIITYDNDWHSLEAIQFQTLPEIDLAVAEFSSSNEYRIAQVPLTNLLKPQQQVFVGGYPLPNVVSPFPGFILSSGTLLGHAPYTLEEGYSLIYHVSTKSGMSGGPVLNSQGELIGIHGKGVIIDVQSNELSIPIKLGIDPGMFLNLSSGIYGSNPLSSYNREVAPATENSLILRGLIALSQAKLLEARHVFNHIIQQDSSNANAYVLRGIAHFNLDDQQLAIQDLDTALELEKSAFAYSVRGELLYSQHDFEAAILDLEKAIQLQPPHLARLYYLLGSIYQELNNNSLALAYYNNSIQLDSLDTWISHFYMKQAEIKFGLSLYQAALHDFETAATLYTQQLNQAGYEEATLGWIQVFRMIIRSSQVLERV